MSLSSALAVGAELLTDKVPALVVFLGMVEVFWLIPAAVVAVACGSGTGPPRAAQLPAAKARAPYKMATEMVPVVADARCDVILAPGGSWGLMG
jgi:hypothetical protein